ncbi:NADH-quinone oxidoreductase subunit NuoE [Paracoccus jeotgali]|uniref:NADH-quinone oxidoreductase subunit NuoE n=1 Tax=Paracoccus jeotgali TaxID=2065379 RepID=UPI0028A74ECF|nr:NADH-quinone oxidoreductase subunit NuoE [Paracoccus jeotgali]
MLRRLSPIQPDSFEFTSANLDWARAQMTKFPEGRQQSAIIPILWRAHEQEGWLSRPALEYCADLLGMPYIRVLEVATFYFMFKLAPVGSVANIQICGTTTCMICGAEDLIRVCREKIAPTPLTLSADGKFSWEEVECLGACANAPMAQIGKDYYEDLTAEKLAALIDDMAAGQVPQPGPQNGRFSSEAMGGPTALTDLAGTGPAHNASVTLALELGDTLKRIDGTEAPILTPWRRSPEKNPDDGEDTGPDDVPADAQNDDPGEILKARPPRALDAPRDGAGDDLTHIKGLDATAQELLNELGVHHFDQIAHWDAAEVAWVDGHLEGYVGRVTQDEWVRQAREMLEAREGTSN